MRGSDEGLKSEPLRAALALAVTGKSQKLEDLLIRHGGGSDPRPNLRLAAALGVEIAALPDAPHRLLSRFGGEDAAPDDPRVFLPMAAAHAWVALLRAEREQERAWAALAELAADERAPVRLATRDALAGLTLREGGGRALVTAAADWLAADDLNKRFSGTALVVEVLNERRLITSLTAAAPQLLDYLARAVNEVAEAPRSAERLDGRRRLLLSLPPTLATVVATLAAGDVGPAWFEDICASAKDPEVRRVLSDTLLNLRKTSLGHSSTVAQRLRQVLGSSAKPLRDPTRLRPGTGRGKSSRRLR
ncbi:MAG: hypothetical protein ABJA82_03700 [Myxococcales bacterium]